MDSYTYPKRFKHYGTEIIVDFTALGEGFIVDCGTEKFRTVGDFVDSWRAHTQDCWIPVETPKRIRLHNSVKDFK